MIFIDKVTIKGNYSTVMGNIDKIKDALGLPKHYIKEPIRFVPDPTKLYYCYGYTLPLRSETVRQKGLEDKIRCVIDREEYRQEYWDMKFEEQKENYKWFQKKKEEDNLPF